ncbi:opioid-binding protein/cell adhesion molecule [Plakobranchus ocellatus]|uniref:Opioid-binding protein/cell adhesion molecule n=1 Tax=Plakobranchus ocellatus TaxID=259542 RepID=A0AAV4BQF4_9GAST|nr:opioid-binding protein/cell adhesion molecule [Plakobranchus ocellatus]
MIVRASAVSYSPQFNDTPAYIQAIEGDRVILPCEVHYLGKNSVIWVNPRKTLISHADRRMIDDHRISVERSYTYIWHLLIRDVRYNDSGTYECRVNTRPIRSKKVFLDVKVPPTILSHLSSDDITVVEGEKITLMCNVTGVPPPNVTWWHRQPGLDNPKKRIGQEGEVLIIHNITRDCADLYECYVNNGIPPAVSKTIKVTVEYPPEVVLPPPKRMGQMVGKETILECQIFAEPQGITSWKKDEIEPPPTTTTTTTTTTRAIPVIHGGRDNNVVYSEDGYSSRGGDPGNWGQGERRPDYREGTGYIGRGQSGDLYPGETHRIRNKGNPATSSLNSHRGDEKPSRSRGEEKTWSVFGQKDGATNWIPHKWLIALFTLFCHLFSQLCFL